VGAYNFGQYEASHHPLEDELLSMNPPGSLEHSEGLCPGSCEGAGENSVIQYWSRDRRVGAAWEMDPRRASQQSVVRFGHRERCRQPVGLNIPKSFTLKGLFQCQDSRHRDSFSATAEPPKLLSTCYF